MTPPSPKNHGPSDAAYLVSALVCAVLVAIPFLAVDIPPITDLPQQTAQVRLLLEPEVGGGPYEVQWWHPNKLGYLPLLLSWLVTPTLAAGRLGVLLIGLSWVTALHWLARSTGRPPAAAALAAVFFFNHLTYWGLLNFVTGLPVFAAWFVLLDRLDKGRPIGKDRPFGWRNHLRLAATAALLYSAHVLWLAAGLGWLVLSALVRRLPLATLALRLAWAAPALVLALAWYPHLGRSGFVSDTFWGRSPLGRLHPEWHLNSTFGGLEGSAEPILALAILCWLVLGLIQTRGRGVHRGLLAAGAMFVVAALCLPGVIQNTIFFASRWLPMGAVMIALACPQPQIRGVRPALRAVVPYVVLACLTAATAAAWIGFEVEELDGLHEALAVVPPGERLLGLDFERTSERIKGFPYYHLYAWAQVMHGGELAHSFANLGSSLVVFRDLPRQFPWTDALDWRARRVRRSDVDHFGYVLIFGPPDAHAPFLADQRLTPVTEDRQWRLYRHPGESNLGPDSPALRRNLSRTPHVAPEVEPAPVD